MDVLTLEILGDPVACICAATRTSAEDVVRQPWFHRDLQVRRSGGAPLWDGSAELTLRDSSPGEIAAVDKHFEEHNLANPHVADRGAVVFLVPLDRDGGYTPDDVSGDYPV